MSDPPTRNQAHAYLNHLRDIRGDRCIESCVHSVAVNTAEECLEAYVSGRLIEHANIKQKLDDIQREIQPELEAIHEAVRGPGFISDRP